MPANGPLVSVIVPTYYRNERLATTLESVRSQTHPLIELIVVDDSGEEHARSVVTDREEVAYVAHETNCGAHAARDTGLGRATGEFVQFLDDDDVLAPEKIEKQVECLEESDDVGVVYCGLTYEDGTEMCPDPAVHGDVLADALRFYDHPLTTSTMLIDAAVLADVRPLDRDSPGADDIGMTIELAKLTAFDYLDESLVTEGRPPNSRGTSWGGVRGRWRILDRYEPLYDRFPPAVRRAALAETYCLQGRRYLEDSVWSPAAIYSFGQSLRYEPEITPRQVGEFLASFGGRPARSLARSLLHLVR